MRFGWSLSPAGLGDDHLGADLVELDPEVGVLEVHGDVLVVADSRVGTPRHPWPKVVLKWKSPNNFIRSVFTLQTTNGGE